MVLSTASIASAVEKAAVLPVSYKIYRTASQSDERAAKVFEAVRQSVEKTGLTPVIGESVESALQLSTSSPSEDCTENQCLESVAQKSGADFAIYVSIIDNDGQFFINVHINGVDPSAGNPFCTFNSMVQRVSGFVETSLKEALEKKSKEEKKEESVAVASIEPIENASNASSAVEEQPVVQEKEYTVNTSNIETDNSNKKISKSVFFTAMGITLALGGAYAIVEGVGYSKWQDRKSALDRTAEEEKSISNMRISSRVLLGCFGAGVITSIILAPFTNFKKNSKSISAMPVFTGQDGGFVIRGEF